MHHKRKKPKSSRAGCLHCKPHKHQSWKKRGAVKELVGTWMDEATAHLSEIEQLRELCEIHFSEEDECYIAFIPSLENIKSHGSDENEAFTELQIALCLCMEHSSEKNHLVRFRC